MSKQFLRQVTVTGADDSVTRNEIYTLTHRFPFVEWGILLSKNNEGGPRFPSLRWIEGLVSARTTDLNLSGHLCGTWVRDIVEGGRMFLDERPQLATAFGRYQLNFHAIPHMLKDIDAYFDALVALAGEPHGLRKIICQVDGVNSLLYHRARSQAAGHRGIDAVALYDISGGAGVLPSEWPEPMGDYCGYAGGLSPDNLPAQLAKIEERITNPNGSYYHIWIDAETHLRSRNNQQFDLDKVARFLEIAEPFVVSTK